MSSDLNQVIADAYRIIEKVGHGGMGTVYRGVQIRLDREVAIKVLAEEATKDETMIRRFVQEALVIARLNNPRIVTIFDVLPNLGGRHFMIMEFVRGTNLEEYRISHGFTLPFSAICKIGIQVCEGLAAAHREGIIHRDIKPENIMVLPSGDVKVMDFGIARLTRDAQVKTQTGRSIGTPLYMSPEQVMAREIDSRSDIYSLGVLLYTLVTGTPPFVNKNPIAVARAHLTETPRLPSEHNPRCPESLEAIVMRAMEKEPGDRFQTVDEMRARLEEESMTSSAREGQETAMTVAEVPGPALDGGPTPESGPRYPSGSTPDMAPPTAATPFMSSPAVTPPDVAAQPMPASAGSPTPRPAPKPAAPPGPKAPPKPTAPPAAKPAAGPMLQAMNDTPPQGFPSAGAYNPPDTKGPRFAGGTGSDEDKENMQSLMDVAAIPHKVDASVVLEEEWKGGLARLTERAQMGRLTKWEAFWITFLLPGILPIMISRKPAVKLVSWAILATSFALLLFYNFMGILASFLFRMWYAFHAPYRLHQQDTWEEVGKIYRRRFDLVVVFATIFVLASIIVAGGNLAISATWWQEHKDEQAWLERRREPSREVRVIEADTPKPKPAVQPRATRTPEVIVTPAPQVIETPRYTPLPTPIPVITPTNETPPPVPTPMFTPMASAPGTIDPLRTPPPMLTDPTPYIATPTPEVKLPVHPDRDRKVLIDQVMVYRDKRAYYEPLFESAFLDSLVKEARARHDSAQLAMAYLAYDLEFEEQPLFGRLLQGRKLERGTSYLKQIQSRSGLDPSVFLRAAAGASARVTEAVTDTLDNITLGRSFTPQVVGLFRDAGGDADSDKYVAATAIALKSTDGALSNHLIEALTTTTEARHYDRIFDWLRKNGSPEDADLLENRRGDGSPDPGYGAWDKQMDDTIAALRK